jgi:hypothetical protein
VPAFLTVSVVLLVGIAAYTALVPTLSPDATATSGATPRLP